MSELVKEKYGAVAFSSATIEQRKNFSGQSDSGRLHLEVFVADGVLVGIHKEGQVTY